MRSTVLIAAFFAMALSTNSLLAATFVLRPGPEGYDTETHPSAAPLGQAPEHNFGGYGGPSTLRTLFKFDLGDVPQNARDTLFGPNGRAYFTIFHRWQFSAPHGVLARAFRLTEDWDEATATATWRNATQKWATPYGTYDPDVVASASWRFGPEPTAARFDVTSLVRDWLDGSRPNYGLILIPEATYIHPGGSPDNYYGGIFTSDNSNAAIRPSMTIQAVPLPAGAPLILLGVAALVLLRLSGRQAA